MNIYLSHSQFQIVKASTRAKLSKLVVPALILLCLCFSTVSQAESALFTRWQQDVLHQNQSNGLSDTSSESHVEIINGPTQTFFNHEWQPGFSSYHGNGLWAEQRPQNRQAGSQAKAEAHSGAGQTQIRIDNSVAANLYDDFSWN